MVRCDPEEPPFTPVSAVAPPVRFGGDEALASAAFVAPVSLRLEAVRPELHDASRIAAAILPGGGLDIHSTYGHAALTRGAPGAPFRASKPYEPLPQAFSPRTRYSRRGRIRVRERLRFNV